MTTKEEFEALNDLLEKCDATICCGCSLDEVNFILLTSVRRRVDNLSQSLAFYLENH